MEILYFEPTDEVTKAIERIRACEDDVVALVLPQNSLILQSIVNLKLIKRISEQNGKKINLVTIDQIGRNLAGQIGLTVYSKIEDGKPTGKVLQKTPEPVTSGALREKILQETEELTTVTGIQVHRYDRNDPLVQLGENEDQPAANIPDLAERGREMTPTPPVQTGRPNFTGDKPPKSRRRGRKLLFWTIGLLGVWIYFVMFLTATRVILTVKGEKATVDTTVTAVGNPGDDQVKLLVFSSEESGEKEIDTTGSKNLGNKAKGTVSLVNYYSSSTQSIPAGSTLTINGLSYKLAQAVVIPGAEFAVEGSSITVKKAGRADGSIEANEAGESYNVNGGRMTIVGVTTERDNKVYGENPSTTGGTTVNKKVVSQDDLDNVRSLLIADLTAKANESTAKQSPSDLMIIGELGKTETVSYEPGAALNAEADKLKAKAKVSVRVAGVTKSDLSAFATKTATAKRANQTFTASSDPTITVRSSDATAMLAQIQLVVEGNVSANLDTEALKKKVVGQKEDRARTILSEVPLFSKVEFRYAPSWLNNRVNRRSSRVSIEVQYE